MQVLKKPLGMCDFVSGGTVWIKITFKTNSILETWSPMAKLVVL